MKTLIVVDMQNDFVTGPLGTKESIEILPKVNKKIDEYYQQRGAIVYTRDTHYDGYLDSIEGKHLPVLHCLYQTNGWNLAKGLHLHENSYLHDKDQFGSLNLMDQVRHKTYLESVELVGVCTDICVISNALILKAKFPWLEIYVDASCCAGTTPEMHKAALQVMKSCQINVINEEM